MYDGCDAVESSKATVAVEVPREAQGVAGIRVARGRAVEGHGERGRPRRGRGGGDGDRRLVAAGVADAPDGAAVEVDVEELSGRADLQVDRIGSSRDEGAHQAGGGVAVHALGHHPDAVAGVVREEQRAVVLRRVGALPGTEGELDPGHRRAPGRTRLVGNHSRGVVVGEVRRRDHSGRRVEVLADGQVRAVVAGLSSVALVARPTEVPDLRGRGHETVDLLPVVPPDVTDPELVGAGAFGDPEGVAQPGGDHATGIGVGGRGQRVGGQAGSGRRVDPDHRAVQAHRVPGGLEVLAAQRPALRTRRGEGGAHATRRVTAGVDRASVLAPVGEVEARAVTGAGVEGARAPELDGADGVAGVLLAPVLDQHLLAARHRVPARRQPGQPPTDHAAVSRGARRGRAGVGVDAGSARTRGGRGRAELVVIGVEDVDIRVRGEPRVQRHAQQAAVPEVVDVGIEVGEDVGRRVGQGVEDLDHAALLGHEHPAVGREPKGCRVRQAAEHDGLGEAGRGGGPLRLGRRRDQGQSTGHQAEPRRQDQLAAAPSEPPCTPDREPTSRTARHRGKPTHDELPRPALAGWGVR